MNELLKPKTQEELCNLLMDLHNTIIAEMSALVAESDAERFQGVDMIRLSTATVHMLYLVNQEKRHIPIVWSPSWTGQEDDRFYQLLNALLLLGNPLTADSKILNGMPWIPTVTLLLSELLHCFLCIQDFERFARDVTQVLRLCGFRPASGNKVSFQIVNLKTGKELLTVYSAERLPSLH